MSLCRNHRQEDPFTRLHKHSTYDATLSWKAKGILSYAFSRPDDWRFYKNEIMQHASDGERALDSGLRELEAAGYLHKCPNRDPETGRVNGWDWHWFEVPISHEEFKNSFRNRCFAEDGKTPPTMKQPPTKNEGEYTKKEQHTEPDCVLFFSNLKALPITEEFARLLAKEHADLTQEEAIAAIEAVKQLGPKSWEASLKTAFREKWKPKETTVSVQKSNELWAREKLSHLEGRAWGPFTIHILSSSVEFCSVGAFPTVFAFKSPSFREDVAAFVRKVYELMKRRGDLNT